MLKTGRTGILQRAVQRAFYGSQYLGAPFELGPKNDQYRELNDMYSELFTGGDSKSPQNRKISMESEIDELNSELQETFNIKSGGISSQDLERIVSSPGRFIIESKSNNPFYNLALEDYVFRHTPIVKNSSFDSERLLFYINKPSVVIGKNQTPWRELYLENCAAKGYHYLRRKSGGGAVVHDLGNVNYSFLTSRDNFDREYFNRLLVNWLRQHCPSAAIGLNERSDITLGSKKVSGSAFKIARGKAYHHGTMLVSSDLRQFSGLLKPDKVEDVQWHGGSVESVRSHVTNISGEVVEDVDEFIDICIRGFKSLYREALPVYYCTESDTITDDIASTMELLQSNDWLYMSSPKFSLKIQSHSLTVEKGIVTESTIKDAQGMRFSDFVHCANNHLISEIHTKL
ncbi:LAFE_0F08900g1_1 [Lachancea fermentati]|uniref:Putative lipoate-protein ligase A n=1 Tax=Lachancea fermentati TaxID=4955 RepID=A0A1G4MFC3_LACFM|nr:LAFE_0F08900g1_1 [Lachancea fermentati]